MATREEKANGIIKTAVVASAAIGIQPAFVDIPFLVAANGAMLVALSKAYNYSWTEEQAVRFIKHLVAASGFTVGTWKALAAVIQVALAASIVGLPLALGVNGLVNAVMTYAMGQAAKHYFETSGEASDEKVLAIFLDNLTLGGFKQVRQLLK
jgi:uncharacterized protein (DUF697 family)